MIQDAGLQFALAVILAAGAAPQLKAEWTEPGRCGTNCLYVLLKEIGKPVAYNKVASIIPADPQLGCTAADIVSAGGTFGVPLEVRKVTSEELEKLSPPYILHLELVDVGGGGHFIAVSNVIETEHSGLMLEFIDGATGNLTKSLVSNLLPVISGFVIVPVAGGPNALQESSRTQLILWSVLGAIPVGLYFAWRELSVAQNS